MMDTADVKEGGGGIAGTPSGSTDPVADNAEAADSMMTIAREKDTASRDILGADKFTANAKNPPWSTGFDQLLGTKRNGTTSLGDGVSSGPKKAGASY